MLIKKLAPLVLLLNFNLLAQTALSQIKTDWLRTSLTADLLYEQSLNHQTEAHNDFRLRETEIYFYAAIDPRFNGVLSLSAHNDTDEKSSVEVHEAYFESSTLLPHWNIKMGQYFLNLGRLNRIHRHDWAATYAPLVYQQFFNGEGLLDSGLEMEYLFGNKTSWGLTLGAVNGKSGSHNHGGAEEVTAQAPSTYFKLTAFKPHELGASEFALVGYFGNNSKLRNHQLTGLNYTYKKRKSRRLIHLIEFETWGRFSAMASGFSDGHHDHDHDAHAHEHNEFSELTAKKQFGAYFNYAYGFNSQWSLGARADYLQLAKANSEDYANARGEIAQLTTYLTWTHSEFFKTRLSLNGTKYFINGHNETNQYQASLQFIFFLGSHPTHDF